MNIRTTRRISQGFFLVLFLWFCVTTTLGDNWWQLRGWPVNWLIQLDPLTALATLLTTGTIYAGLLWALATVLLTLLLGRFFCGWLCPFGTMHQIIGYLGRRGMPTSAQARRNQYDPKQSIKYWILIFLLAVAAAELLIDLLRLPLRGPIAALSAAAVLLALSAVWMLRGRMRRGVIFFVLAALGWFSAAMLAGDGQLPSASLQIGLLDPLALVHRSVNLALLPLLDQSATDLSVNPRYYRGAWLIGGIFAAALLLNLKVPRFYCRYVCPLGALLGILARSALWRFGKTEAECIDCRVCEKNCEGACAPASTIRIHECVLCTNCLKDCRHDLMRYRMRPSAAGEIAAPNLSRRQFVSATAAGLAAIPLLRLDGHLAAGWNPELVRPPGALAEAQFLSRCIKCGQCMRVCPTNVIHPAGLQAGIEGLWTPVLDFRLGTSGCQYKCIACGNICPTAAIRPISLDERLGRNQFSAAGPIRIGTAFVDRGRCLPWSMGTPCIVCEENCPVSPKAIVTRVEFAPLPATRSVFRIQEAAPREVRLQNADLTPGQFGGGDYFCRVGTTADAVPRRILANTDSRLEIAPENPWNPPPPSGSRIEILIRLQQPYVVPERCIGCGVCQHECPVRGKRAIRVTAENATRDPEKAMTIARRWPRSNGSDFFT